MSVVRSALPVFVLAMLAVAVAGAWYWPNRPVAGGVAMPSAKFNSVSYEPYRTGESPLTERFATAAQVDQDLGLIAARSRGFRTYAAIEGDYDEAALARKHGLKMWQGVWLGGDRAKNAAEIAAAIRAANAYPDVIERVVVGNEVLLRKDLPVGELIADIDQVKRAVRQPVTYADVWNFFLEYPQVVPHLDVVTIHILPYWEDKPTSIDGVIAHAREVVRAMRARFPGVTLAIGETGWPSRGRWRRDAAPGVVNEAVYLRRFVAFAAAEGLDYNLFEAFDEVWKYQAEGVVGASWGLWTADRRPKFPLSGGVQENADWAVPAALSVVCGWLLYAVGGAGRGLGVRARVVLAGAAMGLGGALGVAWEGTGPVLFDRFAVVAGIANLSGQGVLALLFVRRLGRIGAGGTAAAARSGREASAAARALLLGQLPAGWRGAGWADAVFDDLGFAFVWAAAVLQALLLIDPRYRDFPVPSFAVPVVVVVARALLRDWPVGGGAREEAVVGFVLLAAAIGGAVQEGARNLQALGWMVCALVLAAPVLARLVRRGARVGAAWRSW